MYEVIIIGAGVAGIACATTKNSENTLLVDSNNVIGKKLSLTGNGRCNITNLSDQEEFLSNIHNYKFLYSAFSKFNQYDLYELVNNEVSLKVEKNNRVFPISNNSGDIIKFLETKLNKVSIQLNETVTDVMHEDNSFKVITNNSVYTSKKLVIATGGLSYPHTNCLGFGHKIAKQFGHKVTKLTAAQAPLYSNDAICKNLQGITLENTTLTVNDKIYSNQNLLFTHFGLSGPLAFYSSDQIIRENVTQITIDFLPNISRLELDEAMINNTLLQLIKPLLFKSVISELIGELNNFATLSKIERNNLVTKLKSYPIFMTKYADVTKGFTTYGGIELSEINPKTFESKLINNLYFIGEVLDIHANTGGYNITSFFSMGINCGENL